MIKLEKGDYITLVKRGLVAGDEEFDVRVWMSVVEVDLQNEIVKLAPGTAVAFPEGPYMVDGDSVYHNGEYYQIVDVQHGLLAQQLIEFPTVAVA